VQLLIWFQITDTPHILSGSHLAILDPQHEFAEFAGVKIGGVKLNIVEDGNLYRDQLAPFDTFIPPSEIAQPFNGSIFRLPLRKSPGNIGNTPISADEISDLLRNFALEELNIALLFLRKVNSIEIFEINSEGENSKIASATIDRISTELHEKCLIRKILVCTHIADSSEERVWRILHAPFAESKAINTLSQRLGRSPTSTLSQHKLSPNVDLAIPLNLADSTQIGRLFTFLPLPLRTEFPIHINALFSLTQSRQNLRNGGEVGIVKGSDDQYVNHSCAGTSTDKGEQRSHRMESTTL
jgi:sacsin